jgi:hypothetical protein
LVLQLQLLRTRRLSILIHFMHILKLCIPTQGSTTQNHTNIHASSGIRTHNPSGQEALDRAVTVIDIEVVFAYKAAGSWTWRHISMHNSRHQIACFKVTEGIHSLLPRGSKTTVQHFLLSFSLLARLWHAPSFLLAPGPRPFPTLLPLVRSGFLPWLTGPYISNRFHTRGLLITLMMKAARTSETLVNFYQTTRRYNPEKSTTLPTLLRCEFWAVFSRLGSAVRVSTLSMLLWPWSMQFGDGCYSALVVCLHTEQLVQVAPLSSRPADRATNALLTESDYSATIVCILPPFLFHAFSHLPSFFETGIKFFKTIKTSPNKCTHNFIFTFLQRTRM